LINLAVVILHIPVGFEAMRKAGYVLFLEGGSFCFISAGILLGFLCRTQASARTLGVLFYLPLLVPATLSDFSEKLNKFSTYVPSYQLYRPLKSILLEDSALAGYKWDLTILLSLGLISLVFSFILIKRRWLM
jgi:ABC-2 type transport system permease protein